MVAARRKVSGRTQMKSFKAADFKAPLQEFDEATPQPSGTQV